MSLTLDEIKSLITALDVKVPDLILAQKADQEKFAARFEKISTDAAAKPQDWRLRAEFDDVLPQASDFAGKKKFDSAFQLLDQAEKLLQEPDVPPTPEPPTAVPTPADPTSSQPAVSEAIAAAATSAEAAASGGAAAEAGSPELSSAEAASVEPAQAETATTKAEQPETVSPQADGLMSIWRTAKDRVDKQVSALQGALRQTKDPACQRIAEMGLNGVTGNLQVGLQVALTECARSGGRDPKLNAGAATIIAQYQQFLQSNQTIALCDENPFGVQCEIRSTLLEALSELERSFKS